MPDTSDAPFVLVLQRNKELEEELGIEIAEELHCAGFYRRMRVGAFARVSQRSPIHKPRVEIYMPNKPVEAAYYRVIVRALTYVADLVKQMEDESCRLLRRNRRSR